MPGESADSAGTKVAERQADPVEQDSGGGGAGSGTVATARDRATAEERGPQVCVHHPPALWAHVVSLSAGETSFLGVLVLQRS